MTDHSSFAPTFCASLAVMFHIVDLSIAQGYRYGIFPPAIDDKVCECASVARHPITAIIHDGRSL
jgi:hypothetical protein